MPELKNYEKFRNLLRTAICDRTQAQFALETGISPEHLSRMLNNPKIHRPSQATLGKIAMAAMNGVTLQDLLDGLDAEDGAVTGRDAGKKPAQEPVQDFRENARKAMDMLVEILSSEEWPLITDSPEAYADSLVTRANGAVRECLGNTVPMSYDCQYARDYFGSHVKNAARYMPVYISMADSDTAAEALLIIYFDDMACPDGKNKIIVKQADCSARALQDLYGVSESSLATADLVIKGGWPWPDGEVRQIKSVDADGKALDLDDPENREIACVALAQELKYDLDFQPLKKFIERYHESKAEAEKRLLNAIFGEKTRWSETLEGTGFWLDGKNPPENLAAFLSKGPEKKHVLACYSPDGFNSEPGQCGKLAGILEQNSEYPAKLAAALDAFGFQDPDCNDDPGWGSAVAAAMRAGTGFAFKYHAPAEDLAEFPGLSEKGCVMLEDKDAAGIQRETVLLAICRYARMLGIDTFGDILFTGVHLSDRRPMTYKVRPRSNEDQIKAGTEAHPDLADFDPDDTSKQPAETGSYTVELKDGRTADMLWLADQKAWIRARKTWNNQIARFDRTPLGPDED